ncbi:MAG: helix-turn-helix domain-containing protein [Anaerolineae bacterium]
MVEGLLGVAELTELLDVHIDSVRRMMREGRLPAVKIGRKWYVRRDVFDALTRGEPVKGKAETGQP